MCWESKLCKSSTLSAPLFNPNNAFWILSSTCCKRDRGPMWCELSPIPSSSLHLLNLGMGTVFNPATTLENVARSCSDSTQHEQITSITANKQILSCRLLCWPTHLTNAAFRFGSCAQVLVDFLNHCLYTSWKNRQTQTQAKPTKSELLVAMHCPPSPLLAAT